MIGSHNTIHTISSGGTAEGGATTEAGINDAIAGTEAETWINASATETTAGRTEARGITETTTGGPGTMATGTPAMIMTVLMSTASKTRWETPEIALGWKIQTSARHLETNAPSHVMPVEAKVR